MSFDSLRAGEAHHLSPIPSPLAGSPRTHDPLGGNQRTEEMFFRLLDLLTYFHARHGHIGRDEIAVALPGWAERSPATERLFYRALTALQTTLGLELTTVSEPGMPAIYLIDRQRLSPVLTYARGHGDIPYALQSVPERNWTTTDCLHAICGLLRTFARTSRTAWLLPTDLEAQWPLTPEVLQQFIRRWNARTDLTSRHHRAVRFLWCGRRFRLSTLWPVASPYSAMALERLHLDAQEAA